MEPPMTHHIVEYSALKDATVEILHHAQIEDGQVISQATADLIEQLELMKEIERAAIYFQVTRYNLKLEQAFAERKEIVIYETDLKGLAKRFLGEGVFESLPAEMMDLLNFDEIVDCLTYGHSEFPFLDKTWTVFID
jgi:hypothetical protein